MATGLNSLRVRSYIRKRRPGVRPENNPADMAILNMTVDPQSLFRRRVPGSVAGRENRSIDDTFRDLLSEANRELASLLRDVRTESHGPVLGDAKGQQVSELLMRAVRCAAKQYMLQAELGNLALTDELTGLYNRRGFMAVAERQMKLGRRSGRGMLLFMIDVDGLKKINDAYGHSKGDTALKSASVVLEETFRDSDVVARLGGDEFAVLAIEAAGHSESTIETRLLECLKSINRRESCYKISMSFGLARFDPEGCASIEDLLMSADQALYEQKRHKADAAVEPEMSTLNRQHLSFLESHRR
jgi:diguanylate cyclase (GGDEF)-like protein